MSTCPNCDTPIEDHSTCPYCEFRRRELLERLSEQQDRPSWVWIAAMAVHGEGKQVERVWWIE